MAQSFSPEWVMRMNRLLPLFLLLALGTVACGDSEVNTNTSGDNSPTTPGFSDQYFMVPAGPANITANVTESVPIKVYLYSKKTGEAVSGQNVSYEIVDDEGAASLAAKNGSTTEDGSASVDLRIGGQEATIRVRADHASSNAVDFLVDVRPLQVGALKVNLVNTAPSIMSLFDIDVRIYKHSDFSCDEFRPLGPQPEGLATQNAPTVNTAPVFENLGTLQRFVITGIGKGDRNQIAGAGCMDNITVQPDIVNNQDLLLQLIPLSPVGTYDAISHWDFTDALADSGSIGAIIVRVLDIFENPGQAIYNEIINLVELLVGGIISGGIDLFLDLTGLDSQFQNMINNFIAQNDALSKIFAAGRDLRDVVANLQIHSQLTIGKLDSNYEFQGRDNWTGLTLYWRWNCDANSPPDCGAIPLVADANGEIGDLGVLSSEWRGRVVAYNQLQIDTHTLSLRYGRLILLILNEYILPQLTDGNANTLTDAFAYWIGCPTLALNITGSDGEICALGACLTNTQIENFCSSAVSTIFSFANIALQSLEFDIGLNLGGQGKLVEIDSDGFADLIEDGTFTGFIQNTDGGQSTPFNATFDAVRVGFDTQNL
jgi:hypothetical protein